MKRSLLLAGLGALLGSCAFQAGGLFQPLNPVIASVTREEPEVPYVPTPETMVAAMLDMAGVGPGDRLIDLGSGDGRIVIAAAARGATALGVEIDSMRVSEAVAAARRGGLEGRASFRRQDLFMTPLHEATVVTLYLLPDVNMRLRPKLLTELRPGARIVSHAFGMGDWQPDAHRMVDGRNAYLWIVPAVAGGQWTLTREDGSPALLELEQRFQEVSGTIGGNGRSVAVTGRISGASLTLASADGSMRLEGRVDDDRIVAADSSWQAVRLD